MSDERHEAYLAGWRAAMKLVAKDIDCACPKWCGDVMSCRRDIAAAIRALPEPSQEDTP